LHNWSKTLLSSGTYRNSMYGRGVVLCLFSSVKKSSTALANMICSYDSSLTIFPPPNIQSHNHLFNYQEMVYHLSSPFFSSDNTSYTILSLWLYCYIQIRYSISLYSLGISSFLQPIKRCSSIYSLSTSLKLCSC